MARGIARRLSHVGLIPLAAFGALAMSSCDTNGPTAAPAPAATATAVAGQPTAGGSASARSGGSGSIGGSGTANGDSSTSRSLPDGTHDGYLTRVDTARRTVTLDKVELLSGEAARKAYQKENPGATDGPPNDYVLVNNNKLLRTLPVTDSVKVSVIDLAKGSSVATTKSSFAKLPAFLANKDNSTLFKVTVTGGKITALESIYLP